MSRSNQLSMYKTTVRHEGGRTIVRYHTTDIVSFDAHTITLKTGGWKSVTTKRKMNQAAQQFGLGYSVGQTDFAWTVVHGDEVIPFDDDTVTLARTNPDAPEALPRTPSRGQRKSEWVGDDHQGRDAWGRTYLGALRDHQRFPRNFPTAPKAEDYRTPELLAPDLAPDADVAATDAVVADLIEREDVA